MTELIPLGQGVWLTHMMVSHETGKPIGKPEKRIALVPATANLSPKRQRVLSKDAAQCLSFSQIRPVNNDCDFRLGFRLHLQEHRHDGLTQLLAVIGPGLIINCWLFISDAQRVKCGSTPLPILPRFGINPRRPRGWPALLSRRFAP